MKTFFTKLHYKKNLTKYEKAMVSILTPAACIYEKIVNLRNFLYQKNIIKSYKPSAKTISVGNLTTGGTGKTPITAAIANYLTQKGYKVAILSRGYGSKLNSKRVNIISDGCKIYYNAQQGGDEPLWLAENCPQVAVLTSSNRVKLARFAQEELNCNALVIDDGYQHIKLQRDINIAVIDSVKQFGNGKMLPAGPLREPAKNIDRANKIIVVNKGEIDKIEELNLPKYTVCNLTTDCIYEIHSLKEIESKSGKVLAFSAIGQPEQFYKLVKEAGYELVETIDFADHHSYSEEDMTSIVKKAKDLNADFIFTTEKDSIKIKDICGAEIYALKLKSELDFEELLSS